jgi:TonB family protein
VAAAVIAIMVLLAQPAAVAADAGSRPPRVLGSPANATENCLRLHAGAVDVSGEAQVTVSVDAEGRVTGATSAPGTPEPLASAAQCVAAIMHFDPALEQGRPVAGKATVAIGFPTRPRLRQDLTRAVQYCQPAIQPLETLNNAYEGRLDLRVKVGKDGKVEELDLPAGVLPWMEEAARCLQGRLDFYPARLRLKAVESWTVVPVDFNLTRGQHQRIRLEAPVLRSGGAEILEAYRACYPEGRSSEARVNYRITVTDGGRVRKAEVVATSGDSELDRAGICILRRLVFVPARRNGVNVESTVNWPILVRPPG